MEFKKSTKHRARRAKLPTPPPDAPSTPVAPPASLAHTPTVRRNGKKTVGQEISSWFGDAPVKNPPKPTPPKPVVKPPTRAQKLINDITWASRGNPGKAPKPQSIAPSLTETTRSSSRTATPTATPVDAPRLAHIRRLVFHKHTLLITGAVVIAGIGIGLLNEPLRQQLIAQTPIGGTATTAPTSTEVPGFATILPKNKSIDELGGWKRISPPNNDPVFAYTDKLDGVPISISQQPLPPAFKADAATQLAELAKKFNATTKLEADGTTIYLGTSAKGPQSVLFVKNDLLIMIKSQNKVSNGAWETYAKSLN